MPIDNKISQKTIPTFWAVVLLIGFISFFLYDSYTGFVNKFSEKTEPWEKEASSGKQTFGEAFISGSSFSLKDEVNLSCSLSSLTEKTNLMGRVFLTLEEDNNWGRRGEKIYLFSKGFGDLQSSAEVFLSFNFEGVPSGTYKAMISFYQAPGFSFVGGCSTKKFEVAGEDSVFVTRLSKEVLDEEGNLKDFQNNKKLIFDLLGDNADFDDASFKLLIRDSLFPDKIIFEKKLDDFFPERGRVELVLPDFDRQGFFIPELAVFKDGAKKSISLFSLLFFGSFEKVSTIEVIKKETDKVKLNLIYQEGRRESKEESLLLLALVEDSKERLCGYQDFDLGLGWPDEVEVYSFKKDGGCKLERLKLMLKPKSDPGKFLTIFETQI